MVGVSINTVQNPLYLTRTTQENQPKSSSIFPSPIPWFSARRAQPSNRRRISPAKAPPFLPAASRTSQKRSQIHAKTSAKPHHDRFKRRVHRLVFGTGPLLNVLKQIWRVRVPSPVFPSARSAANADKILVKPVRQIVARQFAVPGEAANLIVTITMRLHRLDDPFVFVRLQIFIHRLQALTGQTPTLLPKSASKSTNGRCPNGKNAPDRLGRRPSTVPEPRTSNQSKCCRCPLL